MPLLRTKLSIPQLNPDVVTRQRLHDQLNAGLAAGHLLTVVSTPAGFGKTTLLCSWLRAAALQADDLPAAWLLLDEDDNDEARFVSYLVAALQTIGLGASIADRVDSRQPPGAQEVMVSLINEAATLEGKVLLVLDDCHTITTPAIHEALSFLVSNQPPQLHLVLLSREDPPLPLARLRARRLVTELRQRDLRFNNEEAAEFLNSIMGIVLTSEAVAALSERTEGWITGLYLAALALQRTPDAPERFIEAFTGSDRFIMDYLLTEVLERESPEVRQFLRCTSILDQLSAELCDSLLQTEGSQRILDYLDGANLFIEPLDHQRTWYRYHTLFADMLRITLSSEERAALNRQAAAWYAARGESRQALRHALAYAHVDAADAAAFMVDAAEEAFHSGELATVERWLGHLPVAVIERDPVLAALQGWVLALTGQLRQAETFAGPANPRADLLAAYIALLGHDDYPEASRLARLALAADLPDSWRVIGLWLEAEAQERNGPVVPAIESFRAAHDLGMVLNDRMFTATVDMALVSALNNHGRRREALNICTEALDRYTTNRGGYTSMAALLLVQLALLEYEANQLDEATGSLDEALDLINRSGIVALPVVAVNAESLLSYAGGHIEAALAVLRRGQQMAQTTSFTDPAWLQAREAHILLRQGNRMAARRWARDTGQSVDIPLVYMRLEPALVFVRLLLADRQPEQAEALLLRLARFTEACELNRYLLTAQILLTHFEGHRQQAAIRAVELAHEEGYYRAFLDEDPRLLDYLRPAREAAPQFVDGLLAMARGERPAPQQPLLEPVSERELEVLRLIADGLSNAEIGQRLYIAVGTVKRHTNNLYSKLSVNSRTQAIARARELRLI